MTTFIELGLSDEVLKVLEELGFETPTDIQREAIPELMNKDQDLIGLAQTGTGKTAAFGLPLLERMDPSIKATQALVLAPTRELGQQIAEQLHTFSKYLHKINVLAVYGGAPIVHQIKALKKPQHVIIATPGRLIDLIKRKSVKLGQLQYLVLDEADEMLNMGFKEEIDEILAYTPADKLTWLFSATMPSEIKRIVKKYMEDPIEVKVNTKNEVNANIEHKFAVMHLSDKPEALIRFLDSDPEMRGLVFCRTRRDTQDLADYLVRNKYRADALHGDMSQAQRDKVMKRFKSRSLQVLIATDVAARGIDVNDLTHVFHFTLPDQNSNYTHRSGRTARAGKKGISISFIGRGDMYKIRGLQKQLGITFNQAFIPSAANIQNMAINKWAHSVLDKKTKGRIDEELVEKVNTLFGNLSKEELIAKVLMSELEKLNVGSDRDLNAKVRDKSEGRREREGRGGGRGGRDYKRKGKKRNFERRSKGKSKFSGSPKNLKNRYKRKKKVN